MATPRKEENVARLAELVRSSKAVVLADYRGLTMKDFNALRAKLRPENVVFTVVKNTLLRRAAEGTSLADIVQALEGPTAAAFGTEDSIAPARLLADYIREARSPMTIKSGVVEGVAYDAAQVTALAKLPPREVLIAQVVGGLQAPISGLAGTLQTMLVSLVWTLQGVADQKAA